MPSEIIEIRIVTSGARQAARDIREIGTASKESGGAVDFLTRALKGFLGLQLARAVTGIADDFTNLRNRVAVFSGSIAEATANTRGLIDVALRTRQSLTAAGQTFQRFQTIAKDVGLANGEALRFTETLLKLSTIAGATEQESEGALRQFLQGLSANRLSGQELNSVLEQLPPLAILIAKELGIGVGQLRAFTKNQKNASIGTQTLLKVLRDAGPVVDAAFSKTSVTFAQAFTNIRTVLAGVVGEINRVGGALGFLPSILNSVAIGFGRLLLNENAARLAASALNVVVTALALKGLKALIVVTAAAARDLAILAFTAGKSAVQSFIRLTFHASAGARAMALLRVGIIGAKLALLGAVAIFTFFGDTTLPGLETTLFDIAAVLGGRLLNVLAKAAKAVAEFFSFDPATSTLGKYLAKLTSFLGGDILAEAQKRTKARKADTGAGFITAPAGDISTEDAKLQRLKDLLEDFRVAQKGVAAGFDPFKKAIVDAAKDATDLRQRFDDLIGKFGVTKEKVDDLIQGFLEIKAVEINRAVVDAAAAFDPLLAAQSAFLRNRETISQLAEQSGKQKGLEGVDFGRLLAEETKKFELAQLEALARVQTGYNAFFTGVKLGFRQFVDSLGTEAEIIATGIQGVFQTATGALENFLKTGEFSIRDFARSIIDVIRQIVIQLLVLAAVKALTGGAGAGLEFGGLFGAGGGGGADAFANGGRVSGGKTVLVGERGPELFTPPSTGNIVPNDRIGGGTNVTIVNVTDKNEVARMIGSAEGEQAILNVVSKNRGRVKQSIA